MAKTRPGDNEPSAPWATCIQTNRRLWMIATIEFLVIVALALSIVALLPLKTVEPIYIEFQTGANNFVVLARGGREIRANDALLSRELRQYVTYRESIDKITEGMRYKLVASMSGEGVWKNFHAMASGRESLYQKEHFKRSIRILRDTPIKAGIHQLEIVTMDSQDNSPEPPISTRWLITLAYSYSDQKISFDERTINPTGLIVTEYSINPQKEI